MEYTETIETPVQKKKVVIKTLLTGLEREAIDNAEMSFVKTNDGQTFEVTNMEKVALAKKHKTLEVSVISIDDDKTDILARLQKMYDPDYAFVYDQIKSFQKKMTASMSGTS